VFIADQDTYDERDVTDFPEGTGETGKDEEGLTEDGERLSGLIGLTQ
jgi:hypothetical protein